MKMIIIMFENGFEFKQILTDSFHLAFSGQVFLGDDDDDDVRLMASLPNLDLDPLLPPCVVGTRALSPIGRTPQSKSHPCPNPQAPNPNTNTQPEL